MTKDSFPSFDRPPVIETILGVQFTPLSGLHGGLLGAFWKYLGDQRYLADNWTDCVDAPLIESVEERFGDQAVWAGKEFRFHLTPQPSSRLRIQNTQHNRMIQVQNGRLHYNWLKDQQANYPRYPQVRSEFDGILKLFQCFLQKASLQPISGNLWEITYVNHIKKGTLWEHPSDWCSLLAGIPMLLTEPSAHGVCFETFSGNLQFEIPEQKGRLHIELRHSHVESQTGPEALVIKLTARGPISDDVTLEDGLDLGRAAIVKTFAAMTSPKAHKYWERTQ